MDPERTWQLSKWQYQLWAFPHTFEPKQFPRDTDTKVSDAIQAMLQKAADDPATNSTMRDAEQAAADALRNGKYDDIDKALKGLASATQQTAAGIVPQQELAKNYPTPSPATGQSQQGQGSQQDSASQGGTGSQQDQGGQQGDQGSQSQGQQGGQSQDGQQGQSGQQGEGGPDVLSLLSSVRDVGRPALAAHR